jgi:hypothetical protein
MCSYTALDASRGGAGEARAAQEAVGLLIEIRWLLTTVVVTNAVRLFAAYLTRHTWIGWRPWRL